MKIKSGILFNFYFLFVTLALTSCSGRNEPSLNNIPDDRAQQLRERPQTTSRNRGCNSNQNGEVSISRARTISSENAGEYRLSGRCDSNSREVTITIEGKSLDINCSGGRWAANLDLTSIVQDQDTVEISAESESDTACTSVNNIFNCPDEYVPVPRLDNFTNRDFCVMKYEAKREYSNRRSSSSRRSVSSRDDNNNNYDEKAISKSSDDPWIEISHTQAQVKCQNNGLGYRLIRNSEWQTIARHVEDEDRNWSSGKASSSTSNFLNYGVLFRKSGSNSRSSFGRGRSNYANRDWNPEKRDHYLPNGEEIWDMSGGVWEYVDDSTSDLGVKKEKDEPIFDSDQNKKLFGPAGYYNAPSYNRDTRNNTLGLGYAYLSNIKDGIIRGGGFTEDDLGIFSVDASVRYDDALTLSPTGFRCVYEP